MHRSGPGAPWERQMKGLTQEKLTEVWSKILKDKSARHALEKLKKAGFGILHLKPRDATLERPNWADCIAAIPFLPNRLSRRRIHLQSTLQKHWPLVRAMRLMQRKLNDPFCEVSIASIRDLSPGELIRLKKLVKETTDFVEKFLTWNWYARDSNPRNAVIAELRWQIRERTGKPHDLEFTELIDGAFRAAGVKDGPYLTPNHLDRIEKREKESRVKATKRLRSRTQT